MPTEPFTQRGFWDKGDQMKSDIITAFLALIVGAIITLLYIHYLDTMGLTMEQGVNLQIIMDFIGG